MIDLGGFARRVIDSPILFKDGISRMRSWRAPFGIVLYTALLGGFGYTVFAIAVAANSTARDNVVTAAQAAFGAIVVMQLILVSLFTPALVAGAISGERERQTFDVLLVSSVSASGIVLGKLASSLAYLFVLVMTSLPILGSVFLYGGIDAGQFALCLLITVVSGFALGSVSILWSALFRRTIGATVLGYASGFTMYALFPLLGLLLAGVSYFLINHLSPTANTSFTPFDHPLIMGDPFSAVVQVISPATVPAPPLSEVLKAMLLMAPSPAGQAWGPPVEPWQVSVITQGIFGVACLWVATILVRGRRARAIRSVSR